MLQALLEAFSAALAATGRPPLAARPLVLSKLSLVVAAGAAGGVQRGAGSKALNPKYK